MKPVVVAWLAAHGLPTWLAPDYVTMVGAGALLGAWLVLKMAARDGARVHVQARALLIAYGAALLGGYVFEWIRAIPVAIAQLSLAPILFAGRAAYGGLLFGLAAPVIWLRRQREPFAAFLDRATVPMGIAYGTVRVGCFLEGCDYGRPTSSWIGVRFPAGSLAAEAHARAGWIPEGAPSLPVHPTELYESAIGLVAMLFALLVLRRGRRDGTAFGVWLATYALGRFAIELLRGDGERGVYGALSTAQYVSMTLLALLALSFHPAIGRTWRRVAVAAAFALGVSFVSPNAEAQEPAAAPPLDPEVLARAEQRHAAAVEAHRAASEAPRAERMFVVRTALVGSATLGRPDVPSGAAGELDAMVRLHLLERLRIDLGLEGREYENAVARHHSLGIIGELALELGRRIDLTFTLVPHHTWFDFKSDFFTNTNAYGLRYAAGVQLTLSDRIVLGVTPIAFNTTSSLTVGVITQWEPRLWVGVLF